MKYIIDEKDLKDLINDSWELTRLINLGVDNWEGYYEEEEYNDEVDIDEYIKNKFKVID